MSPRLSLVLALALVLGGCASPPLDFVAEEKVASGEGPFRELGDRRESFRGGYEAIMTLFGPETEDRLYELEAGVLAGVGYTRGP